MNDNLKNHKVLAYRDLKPLALVDDSTSDEALVDVRSYDQSIEARYKKFDMLPYTGDIILVRDTLARKLAEVNAKLVQNHNLHIKVVYGYRHPDVQINYFEKRKAVLKEQNPNLDEDELNALAHNFVAVPDVAGHPAGAAVDVTIVNANGIELDMGTGIAEYDEPEKILTFAPGLSDQQNAARKLLHNVMVESGLAPFYGEWWHFSYGDREWAVFYGQKKALYSAIQIKTT